MFTAYIPARERRANTLYRYYISLPHESQAQIATAILMGGPKKAALIYGVMNVRAVQHYHPALKHRALFGDQA